MSVANRYLQPMPYAIALFYEPSLAAALAAGVKLPVSRPGVSAADHARDVQYGIVLPLSHIHYDPTTALPAYPPASDPPLIHSDVPLPGTLHASKAEIHPKTFDLAHSFVRIQSFDPSTMHVPDPAPGESTAAILCDADAMKPWESLTVLCTINVRRKTELRSALEMDGPLLVKVYQLEKMREAPQVRAMLNTKVEIGWECRPRSKTMEALASIATKALDLRQRLLPRLRSRLCNKRRGNRVKRRLDLLRASCKKVRRSVRDPIIATGSLNQLFRAIGRVHARPPVRTPAYLLDKIDGFAASLLSDLDKEVVFTDGALH